MAIIVNRWIKQWRLKNEVMRKLISQLSITNDWSCMGSIRYVHNISDIVIKWGEQYDFDGSTTHREVSAPLYMRIPFRYRRQIRKKIRLIENRDRTPDDLSFFNQYLDGTYTQNIKIDYDKKSEITIWMSNNEITEYHILRDVIWFKNEEDAMAVKLKWE